MTPITVLFITYAVTAFVAMGFVLMSPKETPFRILFGTMIVYGAIGSGLGMLVGYKIFGGEFASVSSVVTGMLVGSRQLTTTDGRNLVKQFFSIK